MGTVTATSTTISTSRASCADVVGVRGVHSIDDVALGPDVEAWFTGTDLEGVADSNLAHHRPHTPERLAAARDHVGAATRTDPGVWHLMRQVHGSSVATITEDVAEGAEMRAVDIIVTMLEDRPLVVLAADCLPILVGGRRVIAAAHAGWRGIVADVAGALVAALTALGEDVADLHVAIGPAIGACCYEVGPEVVEAVARTAPDAIARTRSGAPSVDLRGAARHRLETLGVGSVRDVGASGLCVAACTMCEPGWSSHRRDPASGRHAGIIVRRGSGRVVWG